MLKPFQTREEDIVRISHSSLRTTILAIFQKIGLSDEDCGILADCIVSTDLRGVETHGASTAVQAYVNRYRVGTCNLRPQPKIVRQTPGTAVIDGDNGLGVIQSVKAMRLAIEKARTVGVGVVTAYNCANTGAIGTYAELAVRENMVGMCMSGGIQSSGGVLPTGGAEGRLGTNPIAFAAPAGQEPRFLFDVATSAVAGGKLNLAKRLGTNLLPGWIADERGVPIMTEGPIPAKYFRLPLGSTREFGSHKGYGFSMMVVVMGAMLAGRGMSDGGEGGSAHHFAAYNISAFTELETFKKNMDTALRTLRETKPAPGHDRVVYAGLLAYEEEQRRRANGIPLHRDVVKYLDGIASEMGGGRVGRV